MARSSGGSWVVAGALALAVVPAPGRAAVQGRYTSPLGELTLKTKGGKVTAVAADAKGPCGFKKGQEVLKGSLLDDSITGTLTICSEGPGCGVQKALVVLLVARKGDLLSGAVHSKQAGCKLPLEGKAIALARVKGGSSADGKPMKRVPKAARAKKRDKQVAAAAPASGPPAGRDEPPAAEAPAAEPPVADVPPEPAEAADTPFEQWSPEAATAGRPEGRRFAMGFGKEAYALITRGEFEKARPALMNALKQDPGYAEAYNMMGVTYFARDRYDDALSWYKKALTANPDFGDAYYNIACVYAVEGKKALALRYLRIAMLNGFAQPDVVEKDQDLDGLRGEEEFKEIMGLARGEASAPPPPQEPPVVEAPPPPGPPGEEPASQPKDEAPAEATEGDAP
jgi:TolA-binding protein